jgi:ribosomal protein L37AE/L43A
MTRYSLSTRREWAEDAQADYERDYCRKCFICHEMSDENTMIMHVPSGEWIHEECKEQFIKEAKEWDETDFTFK